MKPRPLIRRKDWTDRRAWALRLTVGLRYYPDLKRWPRLQFEFKPSIYRSPV